MVFLTRFLKKIAHFRLKIVRTRYECDIIFAVMKHEGEGKREKS